LQKPEKNNFDFFFSTLYLAVPFHMPKKHQIIEAVNESLYQLTYIPVCHYMMQKKRFRWNWYSIYIILAESYCL